MANGYAVTPCSQIFLIINFADLLSLAQRVGPRGVNHVTTWKMFIVAAVL